MKMAPWSRKSERVFLNERRCNGPSANQNDILAYLKQHEDKDLPVYRCGSVDDGKSTLIGRLLYDSKLIYEDQLAAIEGECA